MENTSQPETINVEMEVMTDEVQPEVLHRGERTEMRTYKSAHNPNDSVSNKITVLSNKIISLKKQMSDLSGKLKESNRRMAKLKKIEKELNEL